MTVRQRLAAWLAPAPATRAGDPYFEEWRAWRGHAGPVNADTVLSNLSVATRCVGLRSELLASVPLRLYRVAADGTRERVEDAPLAAVLSDMSNPGMTAFEAREFLVRSLDLHGNGYARIERSRAGAVAALWPAPAHAVTVERLPSGRLRYRISELNRPSVVLLDDDVLHVRGPSRDGLVGLSPLQIARGSFGLALAEQQTAISLQRNSLRPSGILMHPGKLSDTAKTNISGSIHKAAGGPEKAGRVLIAEEGMKYEHLQFKPIDAQFLENRRMSAEDVARIFGCPPSSVGIGDRVTYATFGGEARALVQNALAPAARRVEAALERCLLSAGERGALHIEHDLDGLLRGNMLERFQAYRIGREISVFSPNDIRRAENMPAIDAGDSYSQPLNTGPLGTQPAGQPAGE